MLTWEFPPRIIGGISTHAYHLSQALTEKGVTVHVVTCDFPKTPAEEVVGGTHVSRVESSGISQSNFHLWVYHLNSQLIERAKQILEGDRFDLINAHDWEERLTTAIGRKYMRLSACSQKAASESSAAATTWSTTFKTF